MIDSILTTKVITGANLISQTLKLDEVSDQGVGLATLSSTHPTPENSILPPPDSQLLICFCGMAPLKNRLLCSLLVLNPALLCSAPLLWEKSWQTPEEYTLLKEQEWINSAEVHQKLTGLGKKLLWLLPFFCLKLDLFIPPLEIRKGHEPVPVSYTLHIVTPTPSTKQVIALLFYSVAVIPLLQKEGPFCRSPWQWHAARYVHWFMCVLKGASKTWTCKSCWDKAEELSWMCSTIQLSQDSQPA